MSWVYIISDTQDIKIGKANNPVSRLAELQIGNKNELSILRLIETETEQQAYIIENGLHKLCSHYRIKGEWFKKEAFDLIQLYENDKLLKMFNLPTETEIIEIIANILKKYNEIYFTNIVHMFQETYPTLSPNTLRKIVDKHFIFNKDYSLGLKDE